MTMLLEKETVKKDVIIDFSRLELDLTDALKVLEQIKHDNPEGGFKAIL